MTAADILRQIAADKRAEVRHRQNLSSIVDIKKRAAAAPPPRDFAAALSCVRADNLPVIIAEIKYKSPSGGVLRADFNPSWLARQYEENGAACLSVLTDAPYFGGDERHLQQAREACALPVLRKDFMIDEWQIYESRALAADAVLLIAALLSPAAMQRMATLAHNLGMAVLVESHNREELRAALSVDNALIGINNRNLSTLHTSLQTSFDLLPAAKKDGRLVVAESGIDTSAAIAKLGAAGADAFLIGETLMRAKNPGAALRRLLGNKKHSPPVGDGQKIRAKAAQKNTESA